MVASRLPAYNIKSGCHSSSSTPNLGTTPIPTSVDDVAPSSKLPTSKFALKVILFSTFDFVGLSKTIEFGAISKVLPTGPIAPGRPANRKSLQSLASLVNQLKILVQQLQRSPLPSIQTPTFIIFIGGTE